MKELRGTKLKAQPTNSQKLREVETEMKNLQMAGRISQMMVQQMLENYKNMNRDLSKAFQLINDLQYKTLAMQELGSFDSVVVARKVEEMRLKDFNEASDDADKEGNFTVGDVVQKDSTVIITSIAGNDEGLFRSRVHLASCGVPALIEGLEGKPIGTKVTCQLDGKEHVVELLGIRNPPPPATETAVAQVGETRTNADGSQESDYVRVPADTTVH